MTSLASTTKLKPWVRDTAPIKMLLVSRYLIFFCMATTFLEFLLHIFDTEPSGVDFAWKNLVFFGFASTYVGLEAAGKVEIVGPEYFGGWDAIFMKQIVPAFAVVMLIQVFISLSMKFELFAIYNIEIYFFYLNAAWAEETLMRVLFIGLMRYSIASPPDEQKTLKRLASWQAPHVGKAKPAGILSTFLNGYARAVIIIFTTSTVFCLAHFWVYGSNPLLLFSTFLTGLVFGASYYITGNFLASAVPHFMNNAWAAGTVLTNSSLLLIGVPVFQVIFITVAGVIFYVIMRRYVKQRAIDSKKNQTGVSKGPTSYLARGK